MASLHVCVVSRRRFLNQLDVADQGAASVGAFEKVVAEHAVLRQTPAEHMLERIHIVDALSDERSLAEQILVDVADGARVRVDAGIAAEEPAEARAARGRQAHADARLQDAVAGDDAWRLRPSADARMVQRMRH
ncbi:MAG TPA: hypothetical protein VFU71_07265, partial [Burkholderiaceae bacterium]|nr:hypothetical protein [Burkholderiaceae bacterium]